MLLIYMDEKGLSQAEREHCYQESAQFAQQLNDKGQYLGAGPLHPTTTATSVRTRDGKRLVTDGPNLHLAQHDVSFVVCSRASVSELKAYKKGMGWRFNWVSSYANDFNYDYHVSFTPGDLAKGEVFYNYTLTPASIEDLSGISVFYKDQNSGVFHTYSSYARGNEEVLGAYMYLDLTPKGRNENGPNHNLSDWVRHHDRYGQGGYVDATGAFVREEAKPCCHATE